MDIKKILITVLVAVVVIGIISAIFLMTTEDPEVPEVPENNDILPDNGEEGDGVDLELDESDLENGIEVDIDLE